MKKNSKRLGLNNILKASLIGCMLSFSVTANAAPTNQKSFFTDNSTIIYGSQDSTNSKDDTLIAFNLKKQMKSFINMSSDQKINENTLRRTNLILLGHEKSNSLLNFTNNTNIKSSFPLTIGDGSFTFGDKTYSDREDAVAFIYPSPYNAKNYILVYYSNSIEGLERLTQKSRMGLGSEYQLLDAQGKIIREGRFNKDNFVWKFDSNLDKEFSTNSN